MESSNNTHSDLFEKGGRSFINEDFKEAVAIFTELLNTNTNNFQALLYRASANIQLEKYSEALSDLDEAEKLESNSFELLYKKGIAYFKSEKYLEAKDCFKKALTVATSSEQREKLVIWSNKLEIEIEESGLSSKLEPETTQSQISNENIKIIHNWYQNATHVFINLDSNTNLSKDKYDFILEKKSITIKDKNSQTLIWEMNLSNGISPEKSTVEVNNKKVEFQLIKEIENFNWVTVDRSKVSQVQSSFQPSYPTSSKVKKDWSNVEKEINQQLAEDAKSDPNEGMMRLFQEIYGNANEETRRAMTKSFQTSGGTVLSTNWDEVKSKDYEGKDRPDAPKGQEWKKDS